MKKNMFSIKYILLSFIGLLLNLVGTTILLYTENLWPVSSTLYTNNLVLIQQLANNAISGIILAFLGFIFLFYSILYISKELHKHWHHMKFNVRMILLLWLTLLLTSILLPSLILHEIIIYIFIFSITIFSFSLILNYFDML